MKKIFGLSVCALVCIATTVCASVAKITVNVVEEDTGKPVVGLRVCAAGFVSSHYIPTPSISADEYDRQEAITDKNGQAVITGIKSQDGMVYLAADNADHKKSIRAAGYYTDEGVVYKGTKSELGRWQPWNPTLTIKLKRIIKPIPMYAKHVDGNIPELGKPCGYDLVRGDWVAPHGKGEIADLVFTIKTTFLGGKDEYNRKYFESVFNLTFSNDGDGLVDYPVAPGNCGLRLPYNAPAAGYAPSPSAQRQHLRANGDQALGMFDAKTVQRQNYFLRVRTVKNKGEIVSALYGKIHNLIEWESTGFLRFTYYLNPTPNNPNVEFDPKKNLFGQPSGRVGADQSMAVGDP